MDYSKRYFSEIDEIPRLSRQEEIDLSKRIQDGCSQSLHRFITANLKLVVHEANRISIRSVFSLEDLIQEGNLGLMIAAKKYDASKGFRFSTYAVWWIRQSMRRLKPMIHIPSYRKEQIKLFDYVNDLIRKGDNLEDVLSHWGLSMKDYQALMKLPLTPLSLNKEIDDSGATILDLLMDEKGEHPLEVLLDVEERRLVLEFVDRISNVRNRELIKYRFGLQDGEVYSYASLSLKYGLSRETIRKAIFREIENLRKNLSNHN